MQKVLLVISTFLFSFLANDGLLTPVQAQVVSGATINLDGKEWVLATDPDNVGRDQGWFKVPRPDAKVTMVPGIIQETFPTYHGVVWYYRQFKVPQNPHQQGRYLLRFWQVDYLADVWCNGKHVGQHEGTGEPFVLDVTEAVKPQADNLIAVRVLNPKHEAIDGITLGQSTIWARGIPCSPGLALNYGGLIDTVELLIAPAVRVEDLYVIPDPKTGKIQVQANLRNAGPKAVSGKIDFAVSSAVQGETLNMVQVDRRLPVGDTLIETELKSDNPRLWELNDPYMYRVTAQVGTDTSNSVDEFSTRCGFREFRLENGYFRLNGRRLFLKSSQTDARAPGGIFVPHDPELVRRDLVNVKATNQNMIRSFGGQIPRYQIDMCDDIGIMVYQEHAGAWRMEPSPKLAERFNRSVQAMVKRDRNHPCIVIWGVLNETGPGPVFEQGVAALPLIQALDDTRIAMLNSGGFDGTGKTIANQGVHEWQSDLADIHPYQSVPHRAAQINAIRTISSGGKPVFHSEGGVCSAIDLVRLARHFEQVEKTHCEDAAVCRGFLDQFMADWDRWKMADTFANPEDYFHQCVAWMADLRKVAVNAFRANPNLVGYNTTGTVDPSTTGEGMLASTFRELKPGMVDAMFDAFAPLRWCLFVEPVQVYRGRMAKFEAVLANEDVLKPGEYPARLQVVGPRNESIFDQTVIVNIPDPKGKPEPKFTIPVFADEIKIDGPSGKYRFLAAFEKGAAATGGEAEFYVADPAEMPAINAEVLVWGDDPELLTWLNANGIKARAFVPGEQQNNREVILTGYRSAPNEEVSFGELAKHIGRGSHVIFLYPEIFQKDGNRTAWLPLLNKGDRIDLPLVWAHKDDWSKRHPIFDGLPAGGVFDHTFYREIFGGSAFSGQDVPAEVIAGVTNTSVAYSSGLTIAVYNLGDGRFTLNTLHIRQNLGNDPVAERLLRNMTRYAARDMDKPMAELQPDFYKNLYKLGYSYCESGENIPCPLQEGVCAGCMQTCTDHSWPGCDYSSLADYEPAESNWTDGLDNDCDGLVDNEDPSCREHLDGMISYWKLDETVAGPVIDCYGSNHGTNHGAAINQTGQVESAYSFKDNKNYLSFPYSDDWDFGSGDFTIEFWFNPAAQRRMAVFAGDTDYWLGIDFHYQGTKNINIWASSTGTSWDLIRADDNGNGVGSISIPLNQWSHIVYTRDGNQWMTYINGVPDVNITVSGSLVNKIENKRIAKWGSPVAAFGFDGLIDELAIYKRSLQPSEIQEHYENGLAGLGY